MASGAAASKVKGNTTKALIIQEHKRRLKDNIKSVNDNFLQMMASAKISIDDNAHKNPNGRMADYAVNKFETDVRAQLMVRACDELLKLTNDVKEFLILHDFNFLTESITRAEAECEEKLRRQMKKHNELRVDLARLVFDIDKECSEHFSLKP